MLQSPLWRSVFALVGLLTLDFLDFLGGGGGGVAISVFVKHICYSNKSKTKNDNKKKLSK